MNGAYIYHSMVGAAASAQPHGGRRCASAARPAIHFGPSTAVVADERALFPTATRLLETSAPSLELVAASTAPAERLERLQRQAAVGEEAASATELPFVLLPAALVGEDGSTPVQDRSSPRLSEFPTTRNGSGMVQVLGRLALEVRTHTHGVIAVCDWGQWEAVRALVLAEFEGLLAQDAPQRGSGGRVEVHAELVILWYDAEIVSALHFDDLFAVVKYGSEEPAGAPPDPVALTSEAPRALEPLARPGVIYSSDGPSSATHAQNEPLRRASPSSPALLATLQVCDPAGEPRGDVQLFVTDPIVSLEELKGLVRRLTGQRRRGSRALSADVAGSGDPLRLAYRILAAGDLAPVYIRNGVDDGDGQRASVGCPDEEPQGNSYDNLDSVAASQPSGLIPLHTQQDVERMIEDTLFYGTRAIRIVATTATSALASPVSSRRGSAAPAGSDNPHAEERVAAPAAMTAQVESVETVAIGPHSAYAAPVRESVVPPLPPPLPHTHTRAPRPLPAAERNVDEQLQPHGAPALAPERRPPPPPPPPTPGAHHTGLDTDTKLLIRSSSRPPLNLPLAETVRIDDSANAARARRNVIVVRYEVDPTEVLVTGPVTPQVLSRLADSIFNRCCHRVGSPPAFVSVPNAAVIARAASAFAAKHSGGPRNSDSAATAETAASFGEVYNYAMAPVTNTSVDGQELEVDSHVLRLHRYTFSEEEEDELGRCVNEVMNAVD